MAIIGKHNVLQLIRINKTPYWRLYHNESKRQAGNYIDQADFSTPSLDIENSVERLRSTLDMLSTGTYLLVAFEKSDRSKGGIDTIIEIEGSRPGVAAIGSVTPEFHIDGFGKVTPDNFNTAIEAKIKAMQEEADKKRELERLKEENARLNAELRESESGFQRGVISIGSFLYDHVKTTESGREFIGLAQKVILGTRPAANQSQSVTGTPAEASSVGTAEEDRLASACEALSKNNPEWLAQLEKLAKLKETDPSTFGMAIDSLNSMS